MLRRLTVVICGICMANLAAAQERGIINNGESPHVKLRSINIGDCRWTSGFWADKFELCEEAMVPHMGTLLKGDRGHAYAMFLDDRPSTQQLRKWFADLVAVRGKSR